MLTTARNSALIASALIPLISIAPATELGFLPEACAEAEAAAAKRLRILLTRSDVRATWLLGSSVTTLKAARGHCLSGNAERAMLLYGHIIETLRSDEAARAEAIASDTR